METGWQLVSFGVGTVPTSCRRCALVMLHAVLWGSQQPQHPKSPLNSPLILNVLELELTCSAWRAADLG